MVNPLCWSLGAAAGQDVYTEQTGLVPPGEMATYQTLTATPTCDQAIHAFGLMDPCSATTGFSQTEYLQIAAPTGSTDTSATFTITTTWTAVP